MANPDLTRTQIVDKNGKVTHVHKNLNHPGGASVSTRGVTLAPTVSRQGSPVPGGLSDDDVAAVHRLVYKLEARFSGSKYNADELNEFSDDLADYIERLTTGSEPIADDFGSDLHERWGRYEGEALYMLNDMLGEFTGLGNSTSEEDAENLNNMVHDVARWVDANHPQPLPELQRWRNLGDAALAVADEIHEDSPIIQSRLERELETLTFDNQFIKDGIMPGEVRSDDKLRAEALVNARHSLFSDTMHAFNRVNSEGGDSTRSPNSYYNEAASFIIGYKDKAFGSGFSAEDKIAGFISAYDLQNR